LDTVNKVYLTTQQTHISIKTQLLQ